MQALKRFIGYYKYQKKLFIIDMLCAFTVAACDLFYPLIAKTMINEYIPNQNLRLLLVWSGVLLAIYLVKAFLNYVIQYWGHVMGTRIQAEMRRDMFRKLEKLPFSYFDDHKTGALMSRIINDLMDVSELAHHGPENLFLSFVMLIGSFIMLSSINITLTLIVFAVLPFMVWFAIAQRKSMHAAFKKSREEIAEVNAGIEAAISGIRVSRSYAAEEHEVEKFDKANKLFLKARGEAFKSMGKFGAGMAFANDFLYLAVLVAGGLFFFYGKIDIGDFTAYLLYITMFLKPINRLVDLFEQLQNGITGLNRFMEVINEKNEKETVPSIELTKPLGNIELQNVCFKYSNSDSADKESRVLLNLSIKIDSGKTVALVGPSGGGKTTLCNLIPRFYDLDSGKILLDGIDTREYSLHSLRKSIGMVAQEVYLFSGTIKDNIAYGNLDATDEQIIEAAKKANIHDYIMSLEKGYLSEVGERGIKLSGGQKQRISIARAFLKDPPILILDEATSALDNATEMLIQKELAALVVGRTCLIVAHRLSTIKNADEIIVLTGEGVCERGTHEELLAKKGVYAELYRYQFA